MARTPSLPMTPANDATRSIPMKPKMLIAARLMPFCLGGSLGVAMGGGGGGAGAAFFGSGGGVIASSDILPASSQSSMPSRQTSSSFHLGRACNSALSCVSVIGPEGFPSRTKYHWSDIKTPRCPAPSILPARRGTQRQTLVASAGHEYGRSPIRLPPYSRQGRRTARWVAQRRVAQRADECRL